MRTGALALAITALAVAGCAPKAPDGVDKAKLDAAVSKAIGDPSTCVLIAEAGGRQVYRYNTHIACGRVLPSCVASGTQTVADLLKQTAADREPRMASCDSLADGSRGVGWASGPIEGKPLVYAAMMEGDRAFPGRMMAARLARAFKDAGL